MLRYATAVVDVGSSSLSFQSAQPFTRSNVFLVVIYTMALPLAPYVDPDYWNLLGRRAPAPQPPQTDLHAIRSTTNAALKAASEAMVFPAGMTTSVSTVASLDGTPLDITRFVPLAVQQQQRDEADGPAPAQRAVIYAFGGGLIAGGVDISFNMIANYAQRVGAQVFAPSYRLAPEHPYPAALDDIYDCITWLQAHARDFNVDPARIVTLGQSAGAGLVAAAALKARDEALDPPLAAQVLRYPMLDDRTQMDLDDPRYPYLTWLPSSNVIAWGAYLGSLKSDSASHDGPTNRVRKKQGVKAHHPLNWNSC